MNEPSQPTELDKAIEQTELYKTKPHGGWVIPQSTVDILILAAKRLKEMEKERDRWEETCHQLGHGELSVKSINNKLEELAQLRVEYKKSLEALKKVHAHNSESCIVYFRDEENEENEIPTDLGEAYQESELCESATKVLSTPLAIATRKGGA